MQTHLVSGTHYYWIAIAIATSCYSGQYCTNQLEFGGIQELVVNQGQYRLHFFVIPVLYN